MSVVEHKGIIRNKSDKELQVEILVNSACEGCHMKNGCQGGAETQKRIVNIEEKQLDIYEIGEEVILFFTEEMGLKIVILAYVIPVIICVLALVLLLSFNVSEPISALISLLLIVTYFIILYIFRHQIQSKIVIRIKKI